MRRGRRPRGPPRRVPVRSTQPVHPAPATSARTVSRRTGTTRCWSSPDPPAASTSACSLGPVGPPGPGEVSADCVAQDRDDPVLALAQPTRRLDAPSTPAPTDDGPHDRHDHPLPGPARDAYRVMPSTAAV